MRRRVLLIALVSTFAALVVLGVPLGFTLAQRNYREAVLALEREATAAQRLVPDSRGADPATVHFSPADEDGQIALYNANGLRVAGSGPLQADAVVLVARNLRAPADRRTIGGFAVAVPVNVGGDFYGVIRAEQKRTDLHQRNAGAWRLLATLAVGAIVAAGIAGVLLARRLARPAEDLRADARRLGDGDFTVRARVSGVGELDDVSSALAATAERLGDLMERERAFSADVSHQLKTPLASLRLAIETEMAAPNPEPEAGLRDLLVDVDRLEATINGLLALARDTHSHREPLDIAALLRGSVDRCRTTLPEGRTIELHIDAALARPQCSATAVIQAVEVLVENALLHGKGRVDVGARATPGGVVVSVSDQGLRRIDDRAVFQRRADTAVGHGIGLALARRLIETEGGQLRLTHPGPSPRFEILLAA